MISRNAPCPCGSGKQYKRCCDSSSSKCSKHNHFFNKYSTTDTLQTIAGLTLLNSNHGKNLRLENVSKEVAGYFNKNSKKITAKELQHFLDTKYAADPMEDPTTNLFTEVIAFHGGDYLILPGIYESPSFMLNGLLSAIFNLKDAKLSEQFKSNSNHLVQAILSISDYMLEKAGLKRYMIGKKMNQKIVFPNEPTLNLLKRAVFISEQEIAEIISKKKFDIKVLDIFSVDLSNSSFKNKTDDESPFINTPLLKTYNGYLVVSPATLCHALIQAIKDLAEEMQCADELNEAYHFVVCKTVQLALKRLDFDELKIDNINVDNDGFVKTFITIFDADKIGIIQYVPMSQPGKSPLLDDLAKQRKGLIIQISAIKEYSDCQFMDITLVSVLDNDLMTLMIDNPLARTLMINCHDLDILVKSKKTSAIGLWQFAGARDTQIPKSMRILGPTFLDQFAIFNDHEDSFYLSDDGFDISQWQYGQCQALVEEAKIRTDEHCMATRIDGKLAKKLVIRKDKYSPIYFSMQDLLEHELQFALEGFGTSVWIKPNIVYNSSSDADHIYWELTDTIAYWLWQLTDDIKHKLNLIDPACVYYTFELDDVSNFENMDETFNRDPDIVNKLKVSGNDDTVNLIIPNQLMAFFYGGDNEGDRILVRQILIGLNELLTKKGLDIFSNNQINNIIENRAPLGTKKKLIILHSRSNLLLDKSNLTESRYLQPYESSTIASLICELLAVNCPPIGEIVGSETKINLVINIVTKGLLPHLRKTINQYHNRDLLEHLIELNENLINEREHKKISTPTRIACFVSEDQHIQDLMKSLGELSRTTISVRCLIEHLRAEPATGNKAVSKTAIDELIGIMDAIISWGSIGDQITYDMFNIKLKVLATGRIATEKNESDDIFDPYYQSKTKETVHDALNSFNQEFPKYEEERTGQKVPENLNKAFLEEFSITLSRIATFIDILAGQIFVQKTAFISMNKTSLFTLVQSHKQPFDATEFRHALNFLSHESWGDVTKPPKGYDAFDISPWRFNRKLSLLRKPIIICNSPYQDDPLLFWGPRQVMLSRITIFDQLIHDRFKVPEKGAVKKAMSKLSQVRGTSLVKSVLEGLEVPNTILDSEVTISKHGKIKAQL